MSSTVTQESSPRPDAFAQQRTAAANRPVMVLAVDPHLEVQTLIRQALAAEFRVIVTSTGRDGLRVAEALRPEVVLTEEVLPDTRGLEFMRLLRARSNARVIFLTGPCSIANKVRALELGADDYLEKPFSTLELASRIRAVLRRSLYLREVERVVTFDGISIDLNRRVVRKNGGYVDLTRSEWRLLEHLAAHACRVILKEQLLTNVWGPGYRGDLAFLRVWVSRLRRKLEPTSGRDIIKTVKGIGYMLEAPSPPGVPAACLEEPLAAAS